MLSREHVYENMALVNRSDEQTRDHTQVRNQTQVMQSDQQKSGMNVADDVQSVLKSVQTHPFVKKINVRHNFITVILCYTDEQILRI